MGWPKATQKRAKTRGRHNPSGDRPPPRGRRPPTPASTARGHLHPGRVHVRRVRRRHEPAGDDRHQLRLHDRHADGSPRPTGDAVGLTADVYDELMRDVGRDDRVVHRLSHRSGHLCRRRAGWRHRGLPAPDQGGHRHGRGRVRRVSLGPPSATPPPSHQEGSSPTAVSLSTSSSPVHTYLQALRDWAVKPALNNPAGSPNSEGTNTLNAVRRTRNSQLPAAKGEVASSGVPASAQGEAGVDRRRPASAEGERVGPPCPS